ncbi:arsenic resistance N-acetyltransferase ArsN2 [Accumulibacter sp.]|jgi:amino-acid N-acetyltransferase|uniref:arsenic resistance N-acetyltransferase ArsN2 n=1 Tax=Accumulibacter sp. TaxID=2053492 RepID=UPI001AD3E790|nr:arsenic resistance N-acetyltransferase ArsN2 [Accumulibacter sp.]MBN8453326.1 GNAT family N-acetyltransferase [Accumulibacter sp.]MBO3706708.1 GNAT family N-acetyltransferase [Candidatus Accumulibacter conexus]
MSALLPEPALAGDLPDLLALLAACSLPTADLAQRHLADFLVCRDGGRIVASGGLEFHAAAALLRSLAVAPSHRQRGLATRLVDELVQRARNRGQHEILLLTTSAAGFFAARGFQPFDRRQVPPELAQCSEFRDLCPASAVCMRRTLANGGAA